MREKLIELLSESVSKFCKLSVIRGTTKITAITVNADEFADNLIANGVTIQKWVPVTERLPERNEIVLAWCDNAFQECCYHTGYCWETAWDHEKIYIVTHWMPLPEPPSEERRTDA